MLLLVGRSHHNLSEEEECVLLLVGRSHHNVSEEEACVLTGGPEGPGGPLLSCEHVQAWGMEGHCSSTL